MWAWLGDLFDDGSVRQRLLARLGFDRDEVRLDLRGPEFVLPFAPTGEYAVVQASALEPLPLPLRRSTPGLFIELENGPSLGAWRAAAEFEVNVGTRTVVELPR